MINHWSIILIILYPDMPSVLSVSRGCLGTLAGIATVFWVDSPRSSLGSGTGSSSSIAISATGARASSDVSQDASISFTSTSSTSFSNPFFSHKKSHHIKEHQSSNSTIDSQNFTQTQTTSDRLGRFALARTP